MRFRSRFACAATSKRRIRTCDLARLMRHTSNLSVANNTMMGLTNEEFRRGREERRAVVRAARRRRGPSAFGEVCGDRAPPPFPSYCSPYRST